MNYADEVSVYVYFKGRSSREATLRRAHRRSFTPASFIEEDVVDFPDELDTSFFARVSKPNKSWETFSEYVCLWCVWPQDVMMQEEMSTIHDEVFESPSDSTMKDVDSKQLDESELTGSALEKSELERSHLMLWDSQHINFFPSHYDCVTISKHIL